MFSFGFYNSLNGDRRYDAVQMSSIFDGIIEDGVFANIGEFFAVVPGTGLGIIVKTGRAWFNHTWNLNDSHMPLNIEDPDPLQNRIDAVVIEVDSRVESRINKIKVVKGQPGVNPEKPILINDGSVFQHALAYITVRNLAEAITASDIEIVVGKDETPFVQCPLKTVSIEDLFNQWDEEFNIWFENIKFQMTDNVVTNLQRQIDEKVNLSDKATDTDILNQNPDKWIGADKFASAQTKIGDIVTTYRDLETETDGEYIRLDGRGLNKDNVPEFLKNVTSASFPPVELLNGFGNNTGCVYTYGTTTIGDYNYVSVGNNIVKFNKKTNEKVKEVALGAAARIMLIKDNTIYAIYSTNIKLYNPDLVLQKTISVTSTINQEILGIAFVENHIIFWGNSKIGYTIDNFATQYLSNFDAENHAFYNNVLDFRVGIPFGKSGCILHKYAANRFIITPTLNNHVNNLYYSDDFCHTWKTITLSSIVGSLTTTTTYIAEYFAYSDAIYCVVKDTKSKLEIFKADPISLEFEHICSSDKYGWSLAQLFLTIQLDDKNVIGRGILCDSVLDTSAYINNVWHDGQFILNLETGKVSYNFNYKYNIDTINSMSGSLDKEYGFGYANDIVCVKLDTRSVTSITSIPYLTTADAAAPNGLQKIYVGTQRYVNQPVSLILPTKDYDNVLIDNDGDGHSVYSSNFESSFSLSNVAKRGGNAQMMFININDPTHTPSIRLVKSIDFVDLSVITMVPLDDGFIIVPKTGLAMRVHTDTRIIPIKENTYVKVK